MVYQDAACSTKRPQVSQGLVEGKIDSCRSKLFEQYISQLRSGVRRYLQDKRKARVVAGTQEGKMVGMNRGVQKEIAGLTSGTLPCTSSERGKSGSRTVDAGRKEDVLRTGAVEAAHLGSEGEVSAEALEPVQMRQGRPRRQRLSFRPVTPCTEFQLSGGG